MELKPCPFCGSKALFVQKAYGTKDGSEISCGKCFAKAPHSDGKVLVKIGPNGELFTWQDGRQEAVVAWNRRANDYDL